MSTGKKIILIILIIILVGSIAGACYYIHSLNEAKDTNESLRDIATVDVSTADSKDDSSTSQSLYADDTSKSDFVSPIDFEALKQENSDIYGWIRIEDTAIDYPILQSSTDEPDYYVNHTVDDTEGYPGAIFTESDLNTNPFEDNVTVIFGHRMKDDTMFGSLDLWQEDEYRDAHSTISVYTENHTYTYEIAFVQIYDTRNILAKYDCNTPEGYSEFLTSLENVHSIPYWHSSNIQMTTDDHIIVLSTCYGDNRLLVGAVLTEKE